MKKRLPTRTAIILIACLVLLAAGFAFLIEKNVAETKPPTYRLNGTGAELYPDQTSTEGYQKEDGRLIPETGDPQLLLNTEEEGQIRYVAVTLQEPFPLETSVKLFYSDPDRQFTEERGIIVPVEGGMPVFLIEVPKDHYPLLRMNINESVSIASIQVSGEKMEVESIYPLSLKRIMLWFALSAACLSAAPYGGWKLFKSRKAIMQRFRDWTRTKKQEMEAPVPTEREEDRRAKNRKLARLFLIIALIGGVLTVYVMPPLCAPDENVHFVNIYCISKGEIFAEQYEGRLVRWIPQYFNTYVNRFPVSLNGVENANRYTYIDSYQNSHLNGAVDLDETPVPFSTASTVFGYTFSALAMMIGRWCSDIFRIARAVMGNPYNQIMMGRLGNLLFYVLTIYFAIRRAPHFNRTIMLVGLMPMSLFLGSSLNYDAVLIPVSLYFTALILDLCHRPEEKIRNADIAKVCFCVLMIATMKYGAYLPILILLLAVPRTKYGSVKRMILCIGLVLIAAAIGYAPQKIQDLKTAGLNLGVGSAINPAEQTQWLLSNLDKLPQLARDTYEWKWDVYMNSFWGQLGWLDTYYPFPLICTGYTVLIGTALYEACTFTGWQGKRWKNLLALLGCLAGTAAIFYGMYTSFTPVGYFVVEGVQGRYLIPLFMLIVLAVSNPVLLRVRQVRNQIAGERLTLLTGIWGGCCAALTVLMLLLKYWV